MLKFLFDWNSSLWKYRQVQRDVFYTVEIRLSKRSGYVLQKNVQNVYAHVSILLLSFGNEWDFYNDGYRSPHESLETDIECFYACDSLCLHMTSQGGAFPFLLRPRGISEWLKR